MVNEADEALEFRKIRYSARGEKPTLSWGNGTWNQIGTLKMFMTAGGVHRQHESQQSSAGKYCWQKEEFAKQEYTATSVIIEFC